MKIALAVLASLCAAARADVLVVDDSGGPFTNLQAAVNAAAPGDVLLVMPGQYAGFTIAGKPLSVVGSTGSLTSAPWIRSSCAITDLPAGATVSFIGLRIDGQPAPAGPGAGGPALLITDCDGSVRIAKSELTGFTAEPPLLPASPAGLQVERSPDVSLVNVVVWGANGGFLLPQAPLGGAGLQALESCVSLWNCSVRGGTGGGSALEFTVLSADGGPGAFLQDALVVAEGGVIAGGEGGWSAINLSNGGPGAVGDASTSLWLRGTDFAGGPGGKQAWAGEFNFGANGPQSIGPISFVDLPGQPHALTSSVPLLEVGAGVALQVPVAGLLAAGLQGSTLPLLAWSAPLHVAPGALLVPVTAGTLHVVAPPLPVGTETLLVHLQLLGVDHTLGTPLVLGLVDDLP